MNELPTWLQAEEDIKSLFEFYGFKTKQISIEGRQIDLIASRSDSFGFREDIYIIEVTTEKVNAAKGSKDSQKLLLAKATDYPSATLMLITTDDYTEDQKRTLEKLGIIPLTYLEFESRQLDLHKIATMQKKNIELNSSNDVGYNPSVFIEPRLVINGVDNARSSISATDWAKAILDNPEPSLCALLGNLGSGKTTLLQHLILEAVNRFTIDPSRSAMPLYIPLGKYKQHSGNIDQMIMSQLKDAGFQNYPIALVSFLISKRRIILLLDGLDEVHPIQNSNDVLETVTLILEGIGKNSCSVLSCRRQFLESTSDELAYFGSYTSEHIQKIQSGLSSLLRGHPTSYLGYVQPFDKPQVYEYLKRRCGLDEKSVDDLFSHYYGFDELSSTPVLLSMIATTVTEKLIRPEEPIQYPLVQLYEAYTNRWIERDIRRAKLTSEQRRRLSENLADYMVWERKERADWDNIKAVLHADESWKENSLTDVEAELDIRNSGFLIREYDDSYKFVHRSIMEFFAAKVESRRLKIGIKPREFPSDGFRTFLMQVLARDWAELGYDPYSDSLWNSAGSEAIYSSMTNTLAAISFSTISKDGYFSIHDRKNLLVTSDQHWRSVRFTNCKFRKSSSEITFENCEFKGTTFDLDNRFVFQNCKFETCSLSLPDVVFQLHSKFHGISIDAQQATSQLTPSFWYLSRLCDIGLSIFIVGKPFLFSEHMLQTFSEIISKLKGKIFVGNWRRGKIDSHHIAIMDDLIKQGVVILDKSRAGHQLQLSHKGNDLLARLANRPSQTFQELHGLLSRHF